MCEMLILFTQIFFVGCKFLSCDNGDLMWADDGSFCWEHEGVTATLGDAVPYSNRCFIKCYSKPR